MNKCVRSTKIANSVHKWRHSGLRILSSTLYSTETQPDTPDALFQRIQRCRDRKIPIAPVLDQWAVENRSPIDQKQLRGCIKYLRRNQRYGHALEIAIWITAMNDFKLTPSHAAVHLDLLSKVHGVEQAESYFNSLEDKFLILSVYGALLSCYTRAKSLDKAEAIMEKIRKFDNPCSLAYNAMLSLYGEMGKHETLDMLVQEMEDRGIMFDAFTYQIRLNAYAATFDVERMEKLLMKMEADPMVTVNFHVYITAAKGYTNAGALEKASAALKKAEHLVRAPKKVFKYGVLLTFYATLNRKDDVYRLWDLLKKLGKPSYGTFIRVASSLARLDDPDSTKMILEEWLETSDPSDIRIPNVIIRAYCKRGHVDKAELILNRMMESGQVPNASTWTLMAAAYRRDARMEETVAMTKRAFLASSPGWKPDHTTTAACLEYLKKKGDAEGAQEMLVLLEKNGKFSVGFKERVEGYLKIELNR